MSLKRNAKEITSINNQEKTSCRPITNNNPMILSTNNVSEQNIETKGSRRTYATRFDAWESLKTTINTHNPTEFLEYVNNGEYIILFDKGTQEEKWRLELLSCNLNHWRPDVLPLDLLPTFYSPHHLNRTIQITQNTIKKVEIDNDGSDYSSEYDSNEEDQEFDLDECKKYDPKNDTMNANRPDNYSYYLK